MELNLTRIAAIQKRILDWDNLVHNANISESWIKTEADDSLSQLKEALARCWKNRSVAQDDQFKILDLVRKLEELNEQARFLVTSDIPLK